MFQETLGPLDCILTEKKVEKMEEVLAIHRNLSIIIRVMSSDVPKLAGLCKDTYLQNLNNFAWVSISKSLHSLLGHVPELIDRNGG